METLIKTLKDMKLWLILVVIGVLLFGLGFTGAVGIMGMTLIEGMEYPAIITGALMIGGAIYLRENPPPNDK